MNDFLREVKPAFDFLVTEHGYTLEKADAYDAFDNGMLVYESPRLRLEIDRDRGSVAVQASALGDDRAFDGEILRDLLRGLRAYRRAPNLLQPWSVSQRYTAERAAQFLKEHLAELERRFSPNELEDTCRRCAELHASWMKARFGIDIPLGG
jgi:hypothetical protein